MRTEAITAGLFDNVCAFGLKAYRGRDVVVIGARGESDDFTLASASVRTGMARVERLNDGEDDAEVILVPASWVFADL